MIVPAKEGCFSYTIEKSHFWGRAIYIEDEQQAQSEIAKSKQQYPQATAHAYAYCVGNSNQVQRFSDGGEPSGTAGMPMLEIILRQGLSHCLVVVSRQFGGIKLGAGGLLRAFCHTATQALAQSGTTLLQMHTLMRLRVPYTDYDRLRHHLSERPCWVMQTQFEAQVELDILMISTEEAAFCQEMTDLTAAKAQITVLLPPHLRPSP